jgi:16S rRNA C967 or C1407 C5-methylase (RsmB/RsmF family)
VPCSGDGTLRKAPDIWRRWNVSSGNGLHIMQLRIAMQGIRLLEVSE